MSSNGLKGIKTVRDFELEGKVVFLRLDLNVPMENGKITDENRTLPFTISRTDNDGAVGLCRYVERETHRPL